MIVQLIFNNKITFILIEFQGVLIKKLSFYLKEEGLEQLFITTHL